jgi:hypothetical protein
MTVAHLVGVMNGEVDLVVVGVAGLMKNMMIAVAMTENGGEAEIEMREVQNRSNHPHQMFH